MTDRTIGRNIRAARKSAPRTRESQSKSSSPNLQGFFRLPEAIEALELGLEHCELEELDELEEGWLQPLALWLLRVSLA